MNKRSAKRKLIKIRDWARLVGYIVGVVTIVMIVCLFTGNADHKTDVAEAVSIVATASPEYTPTQAVETPEPESDLPKVDITSWEFTLASDEHPIDSGYAPPELTGIGGGEKVDSRIAEQFNALLNAAHACGYTTYICSAYRDYETQYSIYWTHVWDYMNQYGISQAEAEAQTKLSVNPPGGSEHQLGLAIDLLEYQGQAMESHIGGSGLMQWLEENCYRFGFVIRYPDGKQDITGVMYEPWHLRYVGEKAATYMMENNLCLEEFLALYE